MVLAGGDARARLSSSAQSDLVGRRAVSCSRARTMVCAGDGEKVSPVGRENVPSMAFAGVSILKGPGHARARWGSRTHQLVLAVAVHHRGEYIGRAEVLGAAVGGRGGPWRADGHLLTVSISITKIRLGESGRPVSKGRVAAGEPTCRSRASNTRRRRTTRFGARLIGWGARARTRVTKAKRGRVIFPRVPS